MKAACIRSMRYACLEAVGSRSIRSATRGALAEMQRALLSPKADPLRGRFSGTFGGHLQVTTKETTSGMAMRTLQAALP